MEDLRDFFNGKKLYGDNFSSAEIKKWYDDEKEGYSGLLSRDYVYEFHALNKLNGYNKLKSVPRFSKVLSLGGAAGDELLPIIKKIGQIYIVEPSKKLRVKSIGGKRINYVTPKISGKLDFKDNSLDLITCFGTLHHIPNVSFVFKELVRVLKPGGFLLVREPVVSMGDWRKQRKGLTKRERGIPRDIFRRMIKENGLRIVSERFVLFPLLRRVEFGNYRGGNSKFWVMLDMILGKFFSWNKKYHARSFLDKLQPQSAFYVLEKRLSDQSRQACF